MMKWITWIGLVVLLGAAVFWWTQGRETTVIVAEASRGTAVNAVTGTVEVLATADLWVKSERDGRLAEVPVRIGDLVEIGDLIFRQESELLDIQLEQESVRQTAAQARLELPLQAEFDLEARRRDLESLRVQVELGQASQARLDDLQREVRRVEVRLLEERINRTEAAGVLSARVRELEFQRGQMSQTAAIKGEVVEILGIIGNQINARNNVVRIVSIDRTVQMELSEEDMGGVGVRAPVTLRLASYPGVEFRGEVNSLFATADASAKTRQLFVKVEAEPGVLVPGLTGEGYLIKEERDGAVLVPRRALVGNRLYVVTDGVVEVRTVRPGFLSLNRAEIAEGLAPGEQVVLENQDLLRDGQRVRPIQL